MSDFNQVTIQGRLTRQPELRETPSGTPVCDLAVASNRYVKNGDNYTQFTTYLKVTQWNKLAERAMKTFSVGDEVLIVGQLVDDNFVEKDSGKKTSGRLKIDNAHIQLLRKAKPTAEEQTPSVEE